MTGGGGGGSVVGGRKGKTIKRVKPRDDPTLVTVGGRPRDMRCRDKAEGQPVGRQTKGWKSDYARVDATATPKNAHPRRCTKPRTYVVHTTHYIEIFIICNYLGPRFVL